ncbi:MAG: efflux RND transporter periplasmic adaptor subunit [Hyphomicrobiales bacterium]|nr:efflux RND transporter periplasmic adaptor subunit [Hyphomicrobiales bacterium]
MLRSQPLQPRESHRVRSKNALVWVVVIAAAGAALWKLSGHDFMAAPKGPPPAPAAIPVVAGAAQTQNVPVYVRGLGTVQAFQTVTVRTRVDGQITKVLFTEGQEVKAGDPLFQIDQRPFQAALEQAQAQKTRDEAQLQGAQLDLARYQKLLPTGFQTRQQYDQQVATVGQLKGAIAADQAQIDAAQLNLQYTDIRSPIDGRTGARLVDLGNFVQASQTTALVSITQIKPTFVSFTVPQENLVDIRTNQARAPLEVEAYASDDKTLLSTGKLTLIDNQVDTTTGTIHLKATFDNNDERLWPGEFVSARLILATRANAVVVPAQTVMNGPQGSYVYVIKPGDTVERRTVQVASTENDRAVIEKGLALGDRVVVEGQYRLTDGAKVNLRQADNANAMAN